MKRLPLLLATAALSVLAARPSVAAGVPDVAAWRLLAETSPLPPSLGIPFGVYDPVRHRVLVIDGDYQERPIVIHVFDPAPSPHWSTLAVAGQAPEMQFLPAVIYDPVRDRLLILSGAASPFTVWAVTLAGTPAWQQLTTTGVPPWKRVGSSAVYDAGRDRVIIFGGTDEGYPAQYLSDTWALSLATNKWTQLAPAGIPPGGREGHGAMYDPAQQRMLVFGGHFEAAQRGFWNDLWQLSLAGNPEWTELQPAGPLPGARSAFGTMYDPVRRQLIIHGGVNADSGIEPDDVWALSLDGTPTWTLMSTANRLRGRSYPVDVYDPTDDALLACGGGSYPQTSELALAGSLAWEAVLPQDPVPSPGPRSGHAVVRDSRRDRFAVLGGIFGSVDSTVWSFDPGGPGHWSPLSSRFTPDIIFFNDHDQAAAYDSLSDRLIAHDGGRSWSMPATGKGEWTTLPPGPPFVDLSPDGVGWDAGISVDSWSHRLILTGGMIGAGHAAFATVRGVWTLPLDGSGDWTQLGRLPQEFGSSMHASFDDPIRHRLVLVGGISIGGRFQHRLDNGPTVWATPLDSALAWTNLTSTSGTTPPGPPTSHAAFDALRNRLFLFADTSVWVRGVEDTGPWTQLSFVSPRPHVSSQVRYDPVHDQVVALFANAAGAEAVQAWAFTYGPPSATLAGSVVSPHAVALKWDSPAAIGRDAVLERRDGDGAWSAQGPLTFDDFGLATSTDPDVALGHRYDYRIRIALGGTSWASPPVTIAMPPDGSLALAPSSNPAVGALRVAFHLPEQGPARVEAYDVNGRRCVARDVGAMGPGTHTIALGEDGSLRSGVYWVRLFRGNETKSARIVLIR